jgi:hypothetical protein
MRTNLTTVAVLAAGALLGWLAASGRLTSLATHRAMLRLS